VDTWLVDWPGAPVVVDGEHHSAAGVRRRDRRVRLVAGSVRLLDEVRERVARGEHVLQHDQARAQRTHRSADRDGLARQVRLDALVPPLSLAVG
jgi:hypothetical protein